MSRRWVGSLLAVALLSACSPGAPEATAPPVAAPDPAALRAARLDPCPASAGPAGAGADGLPDVIVPCLDDGPPVRLARLRGPAVVNVWATWCPPCVEEMPLLQEVHERGRGRLVVLGLDYEDEPTQALRFLAARRLTFPSVSDPEGNSGVLRAAGPPETLFVDRDGRVVHRKVGPVATSGELVDLVERHLGVRL